MENISEKTFELIQVVDKKMKQLANENIQELGLTAQQGKLIKFIYENQDKNLIQKDLAEYFHKTTASMGSMLKILEREGYIERYIVPENTRQKSIRVLVKGEQVIEKFDEKRKRLFQKTENTLSNDEFHQLINLLQRLNQNL